MASIVNRPFIRGARTSSEINNLQRIRNYAVWPNVDCILVPRAMRVCACAPAELRPGHSCGSLRNLNDAIVSYHSSAALHRDLVRGGSVRVGNLQCDNFADGTANHPHCICR
jgi:hypothetical protein